MTSDQYREILTTKSSPCCNIPFRKKDMGMYCDINGYKIDDTHFSYTLWALCPKCRKQASFKDLGIKGVSANHRLEIKGSLPEIIRNDADLYEGDLTYYLRVVFRHATNLNNPYHNFRHTCHVLWLCYQACIFYSNTLSRKEMRDLLIASLFHDFNHTGKSGPDSVNIARAVAGVRRYITNEDSPELDNIISLIGATEYPHTSHRSTLSLPSQILRDADLAQALDKVWLQEVVFGLASEWGKTPYEVLRGQTAFHNRLRFHTSWAQDRFPRAIIEQKIAEANELLAILDK
jgi:hypothetical protein